MTDTSGLDRGPGLPPWSSSSFWTALYPRKVRLEVTLNETDRLESVLKRFRREITKAGLCFYESPAVQRRRKSKAARRRNRI